ncbi:unnamed protein product [Rhodiola kirilowii]
MTTDNLRRSNRFKRRIDMSSTSTEFATSRRSMGIYDPLHRN